MEARTIPPPLAAGGSPLRFAALGDERLALLVGRGNEAAFSSIYKRYHQLLYRYCRSMLRNDADAQDALQSTFTSAFSALRRGRRDAPLRPWLFRIAHNEAISLMRRRRPEQELSELVSTKVSLEEQFEQREQLASIVADLLELPERQRGALVMRELSDLSHEEIALALQTSVNAAKQTIFEARRSLTEFAEGRAMACDDVCRIVSDADGRMLRSRRVRAHLKHCSSCSAFAAAIPQRSAQLRALAPPLPALAAAGIFARAFGGAAAHGGDGAGWLAAGAGKAGSAIAAKVAAVAVAATAAAGATVALKHDLSHPASSGTNHAAAAGAGASGAQSRPQGVSGGAHARALATGARTRDQRPSGRAGIEGGHPQATGAVDHRTSAFGFASRLTRGAGALSRGNSAAHAAPVSAALTPKNSHVPRGNVHKAHPRRHTSNASVSGASNGVAAQSRVGSPGLTSQAATLPAVTSSTSVRRAAGTTALPRPILPGGAK